MTELRMSYLVGRADRVIRGELEAALATVELSLPELTALSVLASRPGLSNARLARRSLVSPQAMHKVMTSLESRGLVTRSASGGRALEACITDDGRAMLTQVEPLLSEAEDTFLGPLDEADRRALLRMLSTVSGVSAPVADC